MGTSLSGLTPQTTFDGLLKVGDNDPLTADLKAISTGDGTDTILSLSNTALQIGGATTISTTDTWVQGFNSNLRLESAAPSIQLKEPDGVTGGLMIGVDGNTTYFAQSANNDMSLATYVGRIHQGKWAFGNVSPTATAHIKGSGADNTTTSLLVQNSAGTQALKVEDGGRVWLGDDNLYADDAFIQRGTTSIQFGSAILEHIVSVAHSFKTFDGTAYTEAMRITGNNDQFVGIGTTAPAARLHVKGSGNDDTTTSLLVQNSAGSDLMRMRDDGVFILGSGGNSKYFEGTVVNSKFRVIDNSSLHTVHADGSTNPRVFLRSGPNNSEPNSHYVANYINGTYIGKGVVTPTATLHVKGEAPSGTPPNNPTALLVQNSAGNNLLQVTDDGAIDFGVLGLEFSNDGSGGTMSVASDRYVRLATSLNTYSALNAHVFKTNGSSGYSEVMRITGNTDQRVGIGETTPTARLHIKGEAPSGDPLNNPTALLVQNSSGTELMSLQDDGATRINLNNTLKLVNNSGTTRVTFDGEGNLGIRENSPQARLHVKGAGNGNTTTALLVKNSVGTDLLKVEDGGDVKIDNGVAADLKVKISATASKYLELDRQGRQVRFYSGTSGNAGIFMTQAEKFSIGTNDSSLVLLDENSNVRIGSDITAADTSAKLQVDSTAQGFLPPRMTSEQKAAITSPAAGLMVYDTDQNQMNYYNGTNWIAF